MEKKINNKLSSRRNFVKMTGLGAVALGLHQFGCKEGKKQKHLRLKALRMLMKADENKIWTPFQITNCGLV